MGARFLKLSGKSEPVRQERRRTERKLVRASLVVTTGDGESAAAEMNDVSSLGCNLRADVDWIRLGRFVTASLGDDLSFTGIVRWSRDGVHGLEFLRPLPGSVVDELEELFG